LLGIVVQSRSNSLVITDITYVDNQAARLESELAGIPHYNTNQVGQKRQRESSNESDEENNAKKRKTEINDAVDMGNGSGAQEQQNVEPTLSQETCASANDELLELLASWQ
jgi:mannitol-specific phosphotransferase system IIBC component